MSKVRLRAVPTPAIPDRAARMNTLDEICRRKVSELIQAVLVAEVDEFLGRIAGVPAKSATGYRDGYEEARTISYGSTPVTIRWPRVRESRGSCPRRTYCRRISGASRSWTRRCTSCGCKASRRAISSHRYARCWASRRPCRCRPDLARQQAVSR